MAAIQSQYFIKEKYIFKMLIPYFPELFSANSTINAFNRSTQQRPMETNENENMDDILSHSCRLVTRQRKSYTALFKLKVIKYASTGYMKRASYAKVVGWISEAWTSMTNECVKNGFRKALYETRKEEASDAEDEREGDDEDESVETDVPEMHVDIIESIEIHFDDDFEGFE
ncbi:hypothetical protein HZS_5293 [Henneguya salminicola]|nr:hypothetical protein HZS_5293 [Henneguya salminicola]